MTKRRRRWTIAGCTVVGLLLILIIAGPKLAAPFVRAKLQAALSEQFNANLEMGTLTYWPPYGVGVGRIRMSTNDPKTQRDVELFSCDSIYISLAKLPLGTGPLVISRLDIQSPAVHMIHDPEGLVGQAAVKESTQTAVTQSTPSAQPAPATQSAESVAAKKQKLSEMLKLEHVTISDASLNYEDRAAGAKPLLWQHLNLNMATKPASASAYEYVVDGSGGKAMTISAKGSMDIDDLVMTVADCQTKVTVDPTAAESPLPGMLQELLNQYKVVGEVHTTSRGQVPLADPGAADIHATLEIPKAAGMLPGAEAPLDDLNLKLACHAFPATRPAGSTDPAQPIIDADIDHIVVRGGDTQVRISGSARLNTASGGWATNGLKIEIDAGTTRSFLPKAIQQQLADANPAGHVAFIVDGTGPMASEKLELDNVAAKATIETNGVSVKLPGAESRIDDVATKLTASLADSVIHVVIENFLTKAKDSVIQVTGGAKIDLTKKVWSSTGVALSATAGIDRTFLPSSIRVVAQDIETRGQITLSANGSGPLSSDPNALKRSVGTARLTLNATGRLPDAPEPLDELAADITATAKPAAGGSADTPMVQLAIQKATIRGQGNAVTLTGNAVVNTASNAWGTSGLHLVGDITSNRAFLPRSVAESLKDVKATGHLDCTVVGSGPIVMDKTALQQIDAEATIVTKDLAVQSAALPDVMHDMDKFTVTLSGGVVSTGQDGIRVNYGKDLIYLRELKANVAQYPKVEVTKLAGALTFAPQRSKYPPKLTEILDLAEPRGLYFYEGTASLDMDSKEVAKDYRGHLYAKQAGFALMKHRIPVYNVSMDVVATPAGVDVNHFDAITLSGTLSVAARMEMAGKQRYQAVVRMRKIDLNEAAQLSVAEGKDPITVSGEVNADIEANGELAGDPLDTLEGKGALEVANGRLFEVPVLSDIVKLIKLRDSANVGDAACFFTLGHRKVSISQVAVQSDAVGVIGAGTIGFDQTLNMDVNATLLTGWGNRLKGSAVGAWVDKIKDAINTAAKTVLYQIKVKGTIDKPDVKLKAGSILSRDSGDTSTSPSASPASQPAGK